MKVLIVGQGAREHALAWKLKKSPSVKKIYVAPGNAGIQEMAETVPISVSDLDALSNFALDKSVDLTVIGPEIPLSMGIVDVFRSKKLRIFGPSMKASKIESSKVFAKQLLKKCNIPMALFGIFEKPEEAVGFVSNQRGPLVVKADGLAAGKGVLICKNKIEAVRAINLMLVNKVFGNAGRRIIIEEFLEGKEASLFSLTDGKNVIMLTTVRDYKRLLDNDLGPNTGGMGAYSPIIGLDRELVDRALDTIMIPVIKALNNEGCPYTGVLYAGLMVNEGNLKVLEFNCRFGDPETQTLVRCFNNDLFDYLWGCTYEGGLLNLKPPSYLGTSMCIVLADGGYPENVKPGKPIQGLDKARDIDGVALFHAATAKKDGNIITDGGRIMSVSSHGKNYVEARNKAYNAAKRIYFSGIYMRSDIGREAIFNNL